jgi:23S rRNA (adenine1618-N6)-methyltransferase
MKNELHPRNRHTGRYDFQALTQASPELKAFVVRTPAGEASIDFANPSAVRALNRALLALQYGIREWEIPSDYLCPPIPGRADYIHSVADLLAECNDGEIPRDIRCIDIGVGSSCIYPLIGHAEYGWSFVGTDVDPVALESAGKILQANPKFAAAVELRRGAMLKGVVRAGEKFALAVCNPPFHDSPEAVTEASQRKWKNLNRKAGLNFGGKANELWCPGGELAFLRQLIDESRTYRDQILWFTSLVSKESNLPALEDAVARAGAESWGVIPMGQGQKKSRIIAWSFSEQPKLG